MYKIVKKETLNSVVELMEIHAPFVARKCEPGQFIILRVDEYGERIPLTMAGHDEKEGTIDIIVQTVGRTTMLLEQLQVGDCLADVVGPLGQPSEFCSEDIEELKKKESGSLGDVMELQIKEHGDTMITLAELAKVMAHSVDELKEYLEELEESGTIFVFPMKKDTYLWHRDSEFAVRQKIEETLQKYHSEHPYRYGMKKAEIHNTFLKKIKPNIFDAYIERMTGENVYGRREEYLSLPGYEVPKDAMYLQTEKLIEDTFEKAGYDFVRFSEIDFGKIPRQTAEDVVLMMIDEGKVLRINEEMFTMKHLMDEAKEKIQNHLKEENLITIAQVRDMFSTSRKSAKPILEYMDSIKVTKKTGGESERVAYL